MVREGLGRKGKAGTSADARALPQAATLSLLLLLQAQHHLSLGLRLISSSPPACAGIHCAPPPPPAQLPDPTTGATPGGSSGRQFVKLADFGIPPVPLPPHPAAGYVRGRGPASSSSTSSCSSTPLPTLW